MTRARSRFVCGTCGEVYLRWEGQCRACGAWNSLVETIVREQPRSTRASTLASPSTATALSEIASEVVPRWPTGISEFDRVLGGGFVPGSVVLLGGEPGIGKSTLLLQAAAGVIGSPAEGFHVLYASGEESAPQIHLRAARLGYTSGPAGARIRVAAEADVGRIVDLARAAEPRLLLVDSIQTISVDELDGPAGSVGQVREATLRLMELAKGEGIGVVLVGHVTKDGTLAGPKALEHLVDVVLTLEGDRYGALRLLRASKNRFGSTDEVGVFEMREAGLAEVADPGRAFLVEHETPAPGSVVAPTLEGSRPLLVEVQALVARSAYGPPRRTVSGADANRVSILVAVLGRRAGVALGDQDVFVNLAGGLSVEEPGLDLAVALALASALRDRPVDPRTVAIGEVGLLGELRSVTGLDRRLREASRLGFERAIVPRPRGGAAPPAVSGMEVATVGTLGEAIAEVLGATR